MSDIVKFGENISIIQKRATFEKISILECITDGRHQEEESAPLVAAFFPGCLWER